MERSGTLTPEISVRGCVQYGQLPPQYTSVLAKHLKCMRPLVCLQVGQLALLDLPGSKHRLQVYVCAGLLVLRGTPSNPCHTFRCPSFPKSLHSHCLFTFDTTSARKLSGSGKDFNGIPGCRKE